MRVLILWVTLFVAVGCGPADTALANRPCPALPQVDGLCLGISFDSLKAIRPGAFRDTDGIREVRADSSQIAYYFSSSSGSTSELLVGIRIDLAWDDASARAHEALESALMDGMSAKESGVVRMHGPWTRDSVDVSATRWSRPDMVRVARWDALNSNSTHRRVSIWSYAPGWTPPSLGRWIE